MNRRRFKAAIMALALSAFAAGCDHAPRPSPMPQLPTLDRPVYHVPAGDTAAAIPVAALARRSGIPGVFVLQAGLARFRMVRTGKTVDGQVQIISGLMGGETLVLGDLGPVHDGSPIRSAQ